MIEDKIRFSIDRMMRERAEVVEGCLEEVVSALPHWHGPFRPTAPPVLLNHGRNIDTYEEKFEILVGAVSVKTFYILYY